MKWIDFARGTLRIAITGAYPQSCLNRMAALRLQFWDIVKRNDLCVEVTIYRAHLKAAEQAAGRSMCEVTVLDEQGILVKFAGLRRRPVLLLGLAAVLALVFWTQQFLWTIEVEGNESVPSDQIRYSLAELGVRPGVRWQDLDPQRLENRMLDRIPALSWFTINANSARATVLVKERIPIPDLVETREPTNVIATQTGIIESMEVYDGVPMVEKGQTVVQGQLLVSGLTTPWRTTVLHHAMAEVYARTWRTAEMISTKEMTAKTLSREVQTSWRLVVGNKLMKISGDSRISEAGCVKMITSYPLMLPGGITLPITLERVEIQSYTTEQVPRDPTALQERLMSAYLQAVRADMVAGLVHSSDGTLSEEGACWRLWAVCECTEQIGALSPILLETKEDERG